MIIQWFINRVKRWFDDLVQQAIIDGLKYQPDPNEDEQRKNNLFVAGMLLWFVLVAVATYVAVFGGAA